MFFEGSEKKLEVVVKAGAKSLRSYGRDQWEQVVHKSRATILSEISNEQQDAYLLSESSLFVGDNRLIMITCGKTTLVHAAQAILAMLPEEDIELLIYERKREIFPEYQRSNFYQDVKLLQELVPGNAYRFGDEDDHHIYVFHMNSDFQPTESDMTLEILMHGLERESASIFESGKAHNEDSVNKSGVRELLPGYLVDDFIFEPQGYSLNAIKDDKYFTIHVTPQELGSYVSFETNHSFKNGDKKEFIKKVLGLFKPSSCVILNFQKQGLGKEIECDFRLKKTVEQDLCGFEVSYRHYYKPQESSVKAEKLDI